MGRLRWNKLALQSAKRQRTSQSTTPELFKMTDTFARDRDKVRQLSTCHYTNRQPFRTSEPMVHTHLTDQKYKIRKQIQQQECQQLKQFGKMAMIGSNHVVQTCMTSSYTSRKGQLETVQVKLECQDIHRKATNGNLGNREVHQEYLHRKKVEKRYQIRHS